MNDSAINKESLNKTNKSNYKIFYDKKMNVIGVKKTGVK